MLVKIIDKLKRIILMSLFSIIPVKKNKIMYMSYYGKYMNCNPYAIYKDALKLEDINHIWVSSNNINHQKSTNYTKFKSISFYYHLRTSKILIFNTRPNFDIRKKKSQVYIQTWHSSLGFKKIEKDAEKTLSKTYIKNAKRDSKYIDYLLSGSKKRTEMFERNFWYKGRILEVGTPRNDLFFSKTINVNHIKNKLGISNKKKILLYAPTFRRDLNQNYIELINWVKISETLNTKFGNEWVIAVRLHSNVETNMKIDGVLNLTNYPNVQELLLATDLLITDYSSIMFDYMLMSKPCILFCPDYFDYIKNDRELYFKLEELPFDITYNSDHLNKIISNFNTYDYIEKINRFMLKIGSFENGIATKKVIDLIKLEIGVKSYESH